MAKVWEVPEELHWKTEVEDLSIDKLRELQPDIIINTAGKTDLTWCENNPHETFRCNIIAPINLYRKCKELIKPYVHMSSGCVWDGPFRKDGKPFTPYDPVTPACYYSWTKALCDTLLLSERNALLFILRPRQVYSPVKSPRNTLSKLNSYKDLLDTPNSMTSADTIIKTVDTLIRSQYNGKVIMNVYDKGYSTPYAVANLLHEAGLREKPGLLEKSSLDKWHKPKRVDAVICDYNFENLVQPPDVVSELKRVIGEYARA
jgi:dTDP-4-dehydrorhamnose reductase